MNREIKFRTWDSDNEIMEFFDFNDLSKTVEFLDTYRDYFHKGYFSKDCYKGLKNYPLMQFTGLFDKNGKEVFEEDIVKAAYMYHGKPGIEFKAVIIYNEHIGSFRIAYDSLGGGSQDEIYFKHQIEVIGNIFEHPELLTDNK